MQIVCIVESNEWTVKMDALVLAQEFIAEAATKHESVTPQTQTDNHWILTPDNIETIIEYENKIYHCTAWQNQFCTMTENDARNHYNFSCTGSIQSIARDIAILYDYNYTAMTTDNIKQYVLSQITNPYHSILFNPDINRTKQCTIYRSIFHAALPISTDINEAGDHISKHRNAERSQ